MIETTAKSASQQQIEGMFTWAFAKAAEFHLRRRLNKALHLSAIERHRSPEYQRLQEWRGMVRLQQQLAKSGITSRPVLRAGDKRIGIIIQYQGVTHDCFDLRAVDATLTMIAGEAVA